MMRVLMVVSMVVLVLTVFVENAKAGRTIKKHSAIPKKPVVSEDSENVEDAPITQPKSPKSGLVASSEEKEKNSPESEPCEDGQCKKKPASSSSAPAGVVTQAQMAHPNHPYHRPMTVYEAAYRNRLRNPANYVAPYHQPDPQKFLQKLQKGTIDLTRGILSGLGWDADGWEMLLLESIVRTITKDLLFMFRFLF